MPTNESTTTLYVTYREGTLREGGREALGRAVNGEEYEPVIRVNITEFHDLSRLMSEENLKLLTAIVERQPDSISSLTEESIETTKAYIAICGSSKSSA